MSNLARPFETLEGQGLPLVRQVSVFLPNQVGQLLRVTQALDKTKVKILALSILDADDCAVVRLIFDRADEAITALEEAKFAVHTSELLVVRVPPGKRGLMSTWSVLLSSEVSVKYAYPLLHPAYGSLMALSVANSDIAANTLQQHHFEVLGEEDLAS